MLRLKVIPYACLAAILSLIIGVSEAILERPEAYGQNFCLLEQGNRACGFRDLPACLQKMKVPDADCVRELKGSNDGKVATAEK